MEGETGWSVLSRNESENLTALGWWDLDHFVVENQETWKSPSSETCNRLFNPPVLLTRPG